LETFVSIPRSQLRHARTHGLAIVEGPVCNTSASDLVKPNIQRWVRTRLAGMFALWFRCFTDEICKVLVSKGVLSAAFCVCSSATEGPHKTIEPRLQHDIRKPGVMVSNYRAGEVETGSSPAGRFAGKRRVCRMCVGIFRAGMRVLELGLWRQATHVAKLHLGVRPLIEMVDISTEC